MPDVKGELNISQPPRRRCLSLVGFDPKLVVHSDASAIQKPTFVNFRIRRQVGFTYGRFRCSTVSRRGLWTKVAAHVH